MDCLPSLKAFPWKKELPVKLPDLCSFPPERSLTHWLSKFQWKKSDNTHRSSGAAEYLRCRCLWVRFVQVEFWSFTVDVSFLSAKAFFSQFFNKGSQKWNQHNVSFLKGPLLTNMTFYQQPSIFFFTNYQSEWHYRNAETTAVQKLISTNVRQTPRSP